MKKDKKEEVKEALHEIGSAIDQFDEAIEGSCYTDEMHSKVYEVAKALKIKL